MEDAVFFYTPDGSYGDFSNFAKFGVALDGEWWPTAEHYFQAQKFLDPAYREKIRRSSTPKQAADLGRTRAIPLRPDWDEARVEVMRKVVTAKFETHAADSVRQRGVVSGVGLGGHGSRGVGCRKGGGALVCWR
jgi:ribA/ribD-fused uncharacterized protein